MDKRPQDTSAEEPNGGNLHVRLRRGPGRGNRPGLLNSLSVLIVEKRDAIATLALNRPRTMNTRSARLRVILAQTISEFQADTRIQVSILRAHDVHPMQYASGGQLTKCGSTWLA